MLSIQQSFFLRWSLVVVWLFVLLMTKTSGLKPEETHPSQPTGPDDARLAGGGSPCSGRLEMKHQGEWRALIPKHKDARDTYWYAEVACRQMGCGSVVSITHSLNNNQQPGWEVGFSCTGAEATLKECDSKATGRRVQRKRSYIYNLDVICSGSMRLTGGSHVCSGNVEVKLDLGWVSVCQDGFDSEAEKVVCREMDCGPPMSLTGSFSQGGGSGLSKRFQCAGNESRVEECSVSLSNNCTAAAGVSCSGYNMRLVGGEHLCKGTLEGKLNGEWRPLSDKWHDLRMQQFTEICWMVGCGDAISYSYSNSAQRQPVWEWSDYCDDSSSICKHWVEGASASVIALTCSEAVRLVNQPDQHRCSGRLEVKSGQSWLPVCETFFSSEDAMVACRDLSCRFPGGHYGRMEGSHFKNTGSVFKCGGREKRLVDCPYTTLNVTEEELNQCGSTYLTCLDRPHQPFMSVHTQGRVSEYPRVFKGHRFAISCNSHLPYRILSIRLKSLLYTEHASEQIQSPVDGEAVFVFPAAEDAHRGAYQCDYNLDVSSDTFSTPRSFFMTVEEQNDVRLVDGNSRCAGRLEVEHLKEWRPVSYRKSWSLKEADVVCRQLNCGSSVETFKGSNWPETLPAWRFHSDCNGSERALMDCGTVKKWLTSSTAEVVCSDILLPPNISVSTLGEMTDEQQQQQQQDVLLFRRHSFTISCSVEPQYPAGHFSVFFTGLHQTHSRTQPAVNHTARFFYSSADQSLQGTYSCAYHNLVFGHNFSSTSRGRSVTVLEQDDLRLEDGALGADGSVPCAGRLWVNREDEWRMLSADSSVWDLRLASLACRQLGCGSAVSTEEIPLPKKERVFRFFSDCDGSESALLDCGAVQLWLSSSAVQVVCTGGETPGLSEPGGPTPSPQ